MGNILNFLKDIGEAADYDVKKMEISIESESGHLYMKYSGNSKESSSIKDTDLCRISIIDAGTTKLEVVKAVKECFNLTLVQSKNYVDVAPTEIPETITYAEAKRIVEEIRRAGGKTTINFFR